jgi:hypothetical protein
MKLHTSNLVLHVDCDVVGDPNPTTEAERLAYVESAISEINAFMRSRRTGISVDGFVEDGDIRVEA